MSGTNPRSLEALARAADALAPERVELLLDMAAALKRPVLSWRSSDSDLICPIAEGSFAGSLLLFHAMHHVALTKKSFEFILGAALRAAGRAVHQTECVVHQGEDLTVDGVRLSLKTESGKGIRTSTVHISKLMEARWIRECRSRSDFCRLSQERVVGHLRQYDRILSLRSFVSHEKVRYELVEVPVRLLLGIGTLCPQDFSTRTASGSSSAIVTDEQGEQLFALSLDGSVEKVTVRNLALAKCRVHARWQLAVD